MELDAIEARIEDCSTYNFGMYNANKLAYIDAPTMLAGIRSVLALHNSDGERWVGFPRADRQERYCTECNKTAPCPTVRTMLGGIDNHSLEV